MYFETRAVNRVPVRFGLPRRRLLQRQMCRVTLERARSRTKSLPGRWLTARVVGVSLIFESRARMRRCGSRNLFQCPRSSIAPTDAEFAQKCPLLSVAGFKSGVAEGFTTLRELCNLPQKPKMPEPICVYKKVRAFNHLVAGTCNHLNLRFLRAAA